MNLTRIASALFVALTALQALHAGAQAHPSRPIRVIVPYTPGGITDVTTRIVAQELSKNIRQNVLVDNRPGALSFGSSGIGAAAHLTTELLMLTTGVKLTHVPYKGTAPALQALMGGEIQIMMDTPSSMLPHVRAGRIKALGMASEKRVAVAPEIPTLTESGVAVVGGTWVGWLAPARTPKTTVDKLGAEIMAILQRTETRERFTQMGIDPVGNSPVEFARFLRDEVAKWAKVIKDANVRIDG